MCNKHLYIGYEGNCIFFSPYGAADVPELASSYNEVDTWMLLHINHNIDQSDIHKKIFIRTQDTEIRGDVYIKTEIEDSKG